MGKYDGHTPTILDHPHYDDPCIHCGVAHDHVPSGPCLGSVNQALAARVEALEAAVSELINALDDGRIKLPDTTRALIIETHLRQALEDTA